MPKLAAATPAFTMSRQAITTCQPRPTSAFVACRPTPDDAPVTMTVGA